ncbi:hypothetical protein F2Q69_00032260 [Brassica cretica]|uniref:C2H2-type domain-containing protein n=1 Tax=Brassica cretica TaxID=69181 RepID=A0A8S9S1Y3_BRACR|nr:hypothetical protein F2Q69_00032260 [Brassica cretica]
MGEEDPVQERALDARSLVLHDLIASEQNDESTTPCITRKFSDQVVRFKFLDHKNIVKVLGLTTDLEDTLMIVTESLSEGSLYSFIHDKPRELDVLHTSLQICDAMQYLHDRVHEGFQTVRADIFSFGLVLWELVTRRIPLAAAQRSFTTPKESKRLRKKKTWEETCFNVGSLLRSCMKTQSSLVQVIEKCWEVPEAPLTFAAISTLLKSLLTPQQKEVYAVIADDVSIVCDTPKKRKRSIGKKSFEVFGCAFCKRTFKSEMAVEAHTIAKHGAAV